MSAENEKLSYQQAPQNFSGNTAVPRTIEKELNNAMLKHHNNSINYVGKKTYGSNEEGPRSNLMRRN